MILDNETLFSDDQTLTADAASEDIIDLGVARDIGVGKPVPIVIQVTQTFTGTSPTLQAALEVDDNSAFSSAKVVVTTGTLTDPVVGDRLNLNYVPEGTNERYVRLNYTVGGTSPSGKVTAGVVDGAQNNTL